MPRINATVEERHAEQLATMKEEIADGDTDSVSDAEATRRIFDRAQREIDVAQGARRERAKGEQALAKERARREQAVADAQAERDATIEDLRERLDELEGDLEEAETRAERLERANLIILEQQEEKTDLVEYVDEEKSYRRASILTRAKWWVTGMPDDGD